MKSAVQELVARKRRLFRTLIRRQRIGVGAGAARLVGHLAPVTALAVVSGAARAEIRCTPTASLQHWALAEPL